MFVLLVMCLFDVCVRACLSVRARVSEYDCVRDSALHGGPGRAGPGPTFCGRPGLKNIKHIGFGPGLGLV